MSATAAALVAIDWGTSNLRASLLDASGAVQATRAAPGGVMNVQGGRFAEQLRALCGDWLDAGTRTLVASGMVGSRQGWQEAPYLDCPAGIDEAAARLTQVAVGEGAVLHIVPGLRCTGAAGADDVMRGEETQLWGADLPAGSCCVLPGTHSKWAWMGAGGQIAHFATYMTGELYGLLTQHGILGRLMAFGQAAPGAFADGVRLGLAQHGQATHAMFAARTAGLMGRVQPEGLPDYLSGILIGAEIGGASQAQPVAGVVLLGEDELCARYAAALDIAGMASRRAAAGATARGQWRVAQRAGLVPQGR